MFTKKTSIILGAGASRDYDLPTAKEIADHTLVLLKKLSSEHGSGTAVTHERADAVAQHDPATAAFLGELADANFDLDDFSALVTSRLMHRSLDDFIRDNPSTSGPIRSIITRRLFEAMYTNVGRRHVLNPKISRQGRPEDADWIRWFVGMLRSYLYNRQPDNKVALISFNYDFVFEYSIRKLWEQAEYKFPPIDDCFEFIYPHGRFSSLPLKVEDIRDYIVTQSRQLRIGLEPDQLSVNRAADVVASSEHIYTVGFSFGRTNFDMLKLKPAVKRMRIQNYEGRDHRLERLVEQFGMSTEHGSATQLVDSGFFAANLGL